MFRVTEEWVRRYQSGKGGWTRDQLEAVGVAWPPKQGWLRQIVGREVSEASRQRFELQLDRKAVRRAVNQSLFG